MVWVKEEEEVEDRGLEWSVLFVNDVKEVLGEGEIVVGVVYVKVGVFVGVRVVEIFVRLLNVCG